MLKIRLTRIGKKNDPKYRIIVVEKRSKRDGKYVDKIGFYNPVANPHILEVEEDRLNDWIKKGAQFSEGAYKLLRKRIKKTP